MNNFNLLDIEDNSYLLGVMGEGWTFKKNNACKFSYFSAYFWKFFLRISQGLKLKVV